MYKYEIRSVNINFFIEINSFTITTLFRNYIASTANNAYTIIEATKELNIMMPLMPKSTTAWLVDNTTLTFEQIAEFCGLHILEVQSIADDSTGKVTPFDPIAHSQLTRQEIVRCEQDPATRLQITEMAAEQLKQKGAKQVSRMKREDRPNGVLWLIQQHPKISDTIISKLLHTTKSTVESIRNKSYKNYSALRPQNPVTLGLCDQVDLDNVLMSFMNEEVGA